MKVIFLGVDGVLNYRGCKSRCKGFLGVEPEKVALLKQIVDATGAKIVLSSTWRLGYNKDQKSYHGFRRHLEKRLNEHGLSVYDVTEDIGAYKRGAEIRLWLAQHRKDIERWVVLDDEYFPDFTEQKIKSHLVQTDMYKDGLTECHVRKAIRILNRK